MHQVTYTLVCGVSLSFFKKQTQYILCNEPEHPDVLAKRRCSGYVGGTHTHMRAHLNDSDKISSNSETKY